MFRSRSLASRGVLEHGFSAVPHGSAPSLPPHLVPPAFARVAT